jgi:glycosyltransferase involved in cell wall biosynthesis
LRRKGIAARVVREDKKGVAQARFRAIRETKGDWLLFVDDDNELSVDYIAEGLRFIASRRDVGCFGGKLVLADGLRPSRWMRPYLPYLGIKDVGDDVIAGAADVWDVWEPPTAGAFVRRDLLEAYRSRVEEDERILQLGRKGRDGLASCEDSLMMRGAHSLGLLNAYVPQLSLKHHLDESRFRLGYLVRLLHGYGSSQVLLETLLRGKIEVPAHYRERRSFYRLLIQEFRRAGKESLAFGLGIAAYHWSVRKAYLEQERGDLPRRGGRGGAIGQHPRISIVTPSFNAVSTIERTLRSVEAQGYPNLQLICIDGASTDGTVAVIEKFGRLVSHFVSEPDRGAAEAINKGFRKADGDVFCYLNADDELAPGALHRVASAFTEHPDADVITGGCTRFFADGSTLVTEVPERFVSVMALRNDIEQPSTFWRATVHRAVGELDESYRLAFDWEWWNRLRARGARFVRIPDVLSHYHFSESNLTSRGAQRVVDEMARVTRKYGPRRAAWAYQFLYRVFDLNGYYDTPFPKLSKRRQLVFGKALKMLRRLCGPEIIDNYNWNWASKQVRGVVWYK